MRADIDALIAVAAWLLRALLLVALLGAAIAYREVPPSDLAELGR